MATRQEIINQLRRALDHERFAHTLRVEKVAVALARQYGVSVKQASLAALLHDYSRQHDRPKLLQLARRYKMRINAVSQAEPKLLHAQLSARLAQKDFGVRDQAVLKAISKHTLGSPKMTRLEKIIYLADHAEEGRDFSGAKKTRRLAKINLDQAVAQSATQSLNFLLAQGVPIHPDTIQTRNYYLLKT